MRSAPIVIPANWGIDTCSVLFTSAADAGSTCMRSFRCSVSHLAVTEAARSALPHLCRYFANARGQPQVNCAPGPATLAEQQGHHARTAGEVEEHVRAQADADVSPDPDRVHHRQQG